MTRCLKISFPLIVFLNASLFCQAQKIVTFQRSYGGKSVDFGTSVTKLPGADFLVGGITTSYGSGGADILIMRTDSLGKIKWAKTYGGGGDEGTGPTFEAYDLDMVLTPDSNIVVCSTTKSYGAGGNDVYFFKIDQNGNVKWARTFGGSSDDYGTNVINDPNGGFLITGQTLSYGPGDGDVLLIKTDTAGKIVWSKAYGSSGNLEFGWGVSPTKNGEFIITGETYSATNGYEYDALLMRVDKNGKLLWNKSYGFSNSYNSYDSWWACTELPSTNLYIAGNSSNVFNGDPAMATVSKLDSSGNLIWIKAYDKNAHSGSNEIAYDKARNVLNFTLSIFESGNQRVGFMRLDTLGGIKLAKYYGPGGSSGYSAGFGHNFLPLTSGGYAFMAATEAFGYGSWDYYFLKLDSSANPSSCYINNLSLTPYDFTSYFDNHSYSFSTSNITMSVDTGMEVKTVTVGDSLVCAPFVAGFNWKNTCTGQTISFQDSSYYDPTSWKWNFGDASSSSNTSTSQNPTHVYSKTGTYTVKLVSSNGTQTDSITKTITISPSPSHQKAASYTICIGDSLNFKVSGSGGKAFAWGPAASLNDSTDSTTWSYPYQNITYIATVTNTYGCSVQDSFIVKMDTSSKCAKAATIGGIINSYASVSAYDSCYNAFTLDTASFFKVGSTALLIEMKGAAIDTIGSAFGTVSGIGNAGNYEYVAIDSVSGQKVYLHNSLLKTYDFKGIVQLVTVPQYADAIVSKTLVPQPWNGVKGGVLVFNASGKVYMAANIDASGMGFRGGLDLAGSGSKGTCHGSNYYYSSTTTSTGAKGEGIAAFNNAYYTGRGANINGGGGGDNAFSGGAGGGSYAVGGAGGIESASCSSPIANGGIGGLGLGSYIKQNRVFLGGGGGAAAGLVPASTEVANGGGIVLIKAGELVSNGYLIKSNGVSQPTTTHPTIGCGGGAGGIVIADINSYPLKTQVQVNGGNGENIFVGTCQGPGGGGGGGTLVLNASSVPKNLSWSVKPGLFGTDQSSSSACYNTGNGADSGRSGAVVTSMSVPQSTTVFTRPYAKITTKTQTWCAGDSLKLTASVGGLKSLSWSPAGTVKNPTSSNTLAFPTTATTYKLTAVTARGGCLLYDSAKINVFPVIPPTPFIVNSTVTDNADIQLSISMSGLTNVASVTTYVSVDGGAYTKVTTSAPSKTITVTNSSLSASKHHYTYVVIATDSCGNNSDSSIKHAPVELQGTAGNLSNALHWKDYVGHRIDSVVVQRLVAGSSAWLRLAKPKNTDTSYTDNSYMKCGVALSYRIVTYDSSLVSLSDTITLTPYDTVAPSQLDIIYASVTGGDNIALLFKKATKASTRKYLIYVKKDHGAFVLLDSVLAKNITAGAYTYNYKTNTLTDTFAFEVFALDSCGNESKTTETHRSMQLNGKALEDSSSLSWSNYIGFPVKNYIIQTWSKASGWTDYKTLAPNDSVFSELEHCNTILNFRIKAEETGYIDTVAYSDSIQIVPFDTVPPAEVSILSASVADNSHITLIFNKVPDADAIGYVIYRGKDHGAFIDIDTVKRPVSSPVVFTDNIGSTATDTFSYKAYAFDSCGNTSSISQVHRAVHLGASIKGCEKSIYLSWSAYIGFSPVKKYEIYRTMNGGTESLLNTVLGTVTAYKDSLLDYHNKYCYRVLAYDSSSTNTAWGNQSCNQVFFVDTPQIITVTKTVTSVTNGTVAVRWQSINTPHLAYSQLYYSADGKTYSLLENNIPPTVDSFVQAGLNTQSASQYYYLVTVDSCGTKSDSSAINKTMVLTVSVGELIHILNWTKYEGFNVKEYYIQKLQGGIFQTIDSVPSTDTASRFFPAPCNSVERYRVVAEGYSPGQVSWSDTMGRKAIDTIPSDPPIFKNATVLNGTSTQINFIGSDSLDTYDFVVQRSTNGNWATAGDLLFTTPGKALAYIDNGVNTQDQRLCYTIIARDSCLNATPSDTFCVIQLKGDSQNLADSLHWNPFQGYGIKNYDVLQLVGAKWDTLAELNSNDTGFTQKPLPCDVPQTYKIEGFENGGSYVTFSDSVTVIPFDTVKPPAPVIKYVTVLNDNQVELFWHKSVPKVKLYEVSIKTGNGNWQASFTVNTDTSIILSGLNTPDSVYDFRVVAIDSCAMNRSQPSVFHSPVQLGGKGQELSNLLTWKPYQGWAKVEKYYIYQFTGGSWLKVDSVPGTDTSFLQPNLPCGVSQAYQVLAWDSTDSYLSWSDTAQITPFDTTKPPAPVIKYATVLNDNQIELFWHKSVPKVKMYEISIKTGNGNWTVADTVITDTSFIFNGLNTPDSVYAFRIVAIDSCGLIRSQASVFHSPVQLGGQGQELSNLLTWKPYQGWAGVSDYFVYQLVSGSWTEIGAVNGTTASYLQSNLPCDVSQSYRVAAQDNTGQYLSYSDTVQLTPFDTTKPPAPVIDYATVLSDNQIELYWNKSVPKVKLYELSIKTGNGDWQALTTISIDTSFTFSGLDTRDSVYDFRVVAIDSCAANRSANSIVHSPVKISGTALDDSVLINWTPYLGFASVKEYYIYEYGPLGWTILDSVKGNVTSYKSKTMPCNVPQAYSIGTVDNTGQYVSYSDSMHIEPFDTIRPKAPVLYDATVLPGQSVKLSWGWDPTSDVKYFEVWRSANGGALKLIDTVVYDSVFIDTNVNVKANRYAYGIIAIDSCSPVNRSKPSNTDSLIRLQLNTYYCTPQVGLQWTAYTGLGTGAYTVYRSTNGTDFTEIASVKPSQLSFTDNTVSPGARYFYVIEATNGVSGYTSYSDTTGIVANIVQLADSAQLVYATVLRTGETDGAIMVRWRRDSRADTNARGYYVYSYNTASGQYALVEDQADLNDTTYINTNINTLQFTYKYYIVIYNICDVGISSKVHRPVLLTVNNGDLNAQLSWQNYLGVAVKSYTVYKSTDNGPAYYLANTGTDTTLADSNVYCNHTYTYLVQAALANNEISFSDSVTIKGYDTVRPRTMPIQVATVIKTGVTDGQVQLYWVPAVDVNLKGYDLYRSNDGVIWDLVAQTGLTNSYTDAGLNTYSQSYYYRIQPFDSCGNLGDYSPYHLTIHLKATAHDGYDQLNWNAYIGWAIKEYVLARNGKPIATVGKDTLGFKDTLVYCDTTYEYQVFGIGTDANDTFSLASNTDSAKAFNDIGPQKVYIKTVSVSKPNKAVAISWLPSPSWGVKQYDVYRKYAIDGSMKLVGTTTDTTFADSSSEVTQPDCYYVFATDYCGNLSNGSNEGCIMILSARNKTGYNGLNWNGYQVWYDGVQTYNVYKNEDNQGWAMIGTTSSGVIDSFADNNLSDSAIDFCYQVEAVENPGQYNQVSRSTVECVNQTATVFIPNSFTPYNQDGLNDFFGPVGSYIKNYTMQIYNRWGEEIYNTALGKPWDGNFHGQPVQQGVYIYYISVQDYNGNVSRFKGDITMFE